MRGHPRIRSGITTSSPIRLSSCRMVRSNTRCAPAKSSAKKRTSGGNAPTPPIRHSLATGPVQAVKSQCSLLSPSSQLMRNKITSKEKYMGKLEGKIALVTGGNSGIGLATAQQFVNEGAYVFITGRREPELARAVKEIGRNVSGVQGDVANLGDLDRLFAQIKQEKGKLDIVFANAGGAKFARLGEITEEHYDSIFNGNVKGLLFTVQKALPLLPDGASIILNASVAGSTAPSPEWSVYNATKAAIRSFAR